LKLPLPMVSTVTVSSADPASITRRSPTKMLDIALLGDTVTVAVPLAVTAVPSVTTVGSEMGPACPTSC
jgi:hypothetical protein